MHVLPVRSAGAPENMALDFLLLQRYPEAAVPRFRHYGWHRPAFTFGYGQKIAWVNAQLPPDGPFDLCRRPTGGGIVDHRNDWTYLWVIPRGHALEEMRAAHSYRAGHECLAEALKLQGVPAELKMAPDDTERPPGICFEQAEVYDVVHGVTGAKIAGAAQKRNKHGLLFQGSIWRPAAGGDCVDWERFGADFSTRLAAVLGQTADPTPWPDLNEDEVSGLIEQYSSPEWRDYR